ncbi:MAG: hypothetical protein H7308_16770 [Chthonomonadaceae bacterium]|nr:hypothetical protein [Chthonomonadaceae bacterium]
MATSLKMNGEDVAQRGKARYEANIRAEVETPENIGKMVIIDVEAGEYGVDGVLRLDFFRRCVLTLDFRSGEISLR